MTNTKEEQAVWDGYFGTAMGWSMHPGYYRDNATKPTLNDCADIATKMLEIRRKRIES
jgi:hypothetical protein